MAYPKGTRRRTILMPTARSKAIRLAAEYLGVSGEKFITEAITEHLRVTYERMLSELP
jgi:hypothetical protein